MRRTTRFWVLGLLVCFAAVAAAVYWAEPASAQRIEISREELLPAIAVQERHTEGLLAIRDVLGTGVGADVAGRPIIKVYVAREDVRGIPARLEGYTVIREVTGPIVAFKGPPGGGGGNGGGGVDPTMRFERPVPIGVSTGHPDITAGTIGCRVISGGNVYALSNNHVYANQNDASIGDNVLQPGAFDGGLDPQDAIGTLADFEPINFSGQNNVIDAAIAATTTADVGNSTPSDGYGTPRSVTAEAAIQQRVMKYGRTTSQTKGRVIGLNVTINVQYGTNKIARFVNQIQIGGGGFSAGGDSGSLIVVERGTDARKPVGLLFAGGAGSTFANPIDPVLDRFGVTVDGN